MTLPCQSKQSSSAAIITREMVRVRANCDSEAGTAKRRIRDFNVGFLAKAEGNVCATGTDPSRLYKSLDVKSALPGRMNYSSRLASKLASEPSSMM
jgi:hypothetical protein